ncbi:MAG: succinate dehydrogenase cytochrome b subunit [Candidatus Omnitrophica bacterium]|nr:succinate dehydrogenase cytochrome b subunit [Candidatus Omnitrophota bacterium]
MFSNSSIFKKQVVAFTGLLLIFFIFTHLGGNLFIYAGPGVFNSYAHKLHSVGPLLLLPRTLLFIIFVIHITFTCLVVIENIKARGGHKRYSMQKSVGNRSMAESIMPYSGLYIFVFVIFHIIDFAFANQHGVRSFLHGRSYGLYGIVFNSFKDPVYDLLYIFFICFLGLHLCHGVQSLVQTSGFRPKWASVIKMISDYFALLMILGFSSIPIYVYILSRP